MAEAALSPRRYFVYLANGHWTTHHPPNDAVATAAERVARILQAPPLVFEWLRRLAKAVASGEAEMPHGFGFGVVRDAQRRLAGARLYLQNGPYGTLPDLPLRWPLLSPVWNASAAQRLSELLDLAEPHQIAALEWSPGDADTVHFRQYVRLEHDGPSTRNAIALAAHVVSTLEQAKPHQAPAGPQPEPVAVDLRRFAVAANADVEVMGSSVVSSAGTPQIEASKIGLFMGRLEDSYRVDVLLQLIQRTIHNGAAASVQAWLNVTNQAYPGTLHVVQVAFGLSSSDQRPTVTVYQVPAAEESICRRTIPEKDSYWEPHPLEETRIVLDSDAVWPPPPEDVNGSIQMMMGHAEADARVFLRSRYQTSVVHARRPQARTHFEESLMDREEARAILETLASRGLLARSARAHQQTQRVGLDRNVTAESILDQMVAKHNRSVVVTLDALLEEHGNAEFHETEAQQPSRRLRSLVASLRRALGAKISVNLYLSAAGDTVLPAHTDRYDVFVLQLWGRKAWKTCSPRAGSLSRLSEAERAELREVQIGKGDGCTEYNETVRMADDLHSSELECTERQVEAGDALYLPKGIVHAAYTDQAASVAHLTISVPMRGRTWGDLLSHVANAEADELPMAADVRCVLRTALRHTIQESSRRPEGIGWRRDWSQRARPSQPAFPAHLASESCTHGGPTVEACQCLAGTHSRNLLLSNPGGSRCQPGCSSRGRLLRPPTRQPSLTTRESRCASSSAARICARASVTACHARYPSADKRPSRLSLRIPVPH